MKKQKILLLSTIIIALLIIVGVPGLKSMATAEPKLNNISILTENVAPGGKVYMQIEGDKSDIKEINVFMAGEGLYITCKVNDIQTQNPYFNMPNQATSGNTWKVGVMQVTYNDDTKEAYSPESASPNIFKMSGNGTVSVDLDYATVKIKNNEVKIGERVYVDLQVPNIETARYVSVSYTSGEKKSVVYVSDIKTNPYIKFNEAGTYKLDALFVWPEGKDYSNIYYVDYEGFNNRNKLIIEGSNEINVVEKYTQNIIIGGGNKKIGDKVTIYKDGMKNLEGISSIKLSFYDVENKNGIWALSLIDTGLVYQFTIPSYWKEGHTYKLDSIALQYENEESVKYFVSDSIFAKYGELLEVKGTDTITVLANDINVNYTSHIQNIGWENATRWNGEESGTTGQSLRLESVCLNLAKVNQIPGNIQYRTHIQNIGWENEWKSNGEISGTEGQALRLEAIEVKLTGEVAEYYDVYYRVHAENFGWLDWAKNGAPAGTQGYAYRLEALQVVLVKKGEEAPGKTGNTFKCNTKVQYTSHVENIGWQGYVENGQMSGTQGQSLRLEGLRIKLENMPYEGDIVYSTHVQDIGWQSEVRNNEMSGTQGQALRLEAMTIRLTGELAEHYDIYYKVHAQDFGWLGWAKNGEVSGTTGLAKRLEGLEIVLVEKGDKAPVSTMSQAYIR